MCLKDVVVHAPLGPPSPGLPAVHSTFRSFHQPWELDQTRQLAAGPHQHHHQYMQPIYCTDIVPIKVLLLLLTLTPVVRAPTLSFPACNTLIIFTSLRYCFVYF